MKILMLTIGYPPRQIGGTEVYVAGLVEALQRRGHVSEVAYLEEVAEGRDLEVRCDNRNGTAVHAIIVPRSRYKMEFLLFDPILRERLISEFRSLATRVAPDVIHVHPLQIGLESYVMEALRNDGHHVMLTFHSSTTTCARGDLLQFGREVCDGRIVQTRCTECLFHRRGVPRAAAAFLSRIPLACYRVGHTSLKNGRLRRLRSFLSLPLLIEERTHAWRRATEAAERVVAVAAWVKQVSMLNGVPERKMVLSRHGRQLQGSVRTFVPPPLPRFGFLGRLSPEKGVDVLLEAVRRTKEAKFEIEFVSATFAAPRRSAEEERVVDMLKAAAAADPRLRLRGSVPETDLGDILATWDALVVPSLWLESGPQVIYEALSIKTPVIGSRRGGIAELIRHGENGFLFTPGDAQELAGLLERFAADPSPLRTMRSGIPPVRTTDDVAAEMLDEYETMVTPEAAR